MKIYKPGIHNMGIRETNIRYQLGVVGFILALLQVILIIHYNLSPAFCVVTMVPLLLGFEGYFQGHHHFCATYAMLRIYDKDNEGRRKGKITNKLLHEKDMRRMFKIHIYSIISSLIVFALIFLSYSMHFNGIPF